MEAGLSPGIFRWGGTGTWGGGDINTKLNHLYVIKSLQVAEFSDCGQTSRFHKNSLGVTCNKMDGSIFI